MFEQTAEVVCQGCEHDGIHSRSSWDRAVLASTEEIERDSSLDQSGAPLEFEEGVEVSFKQVNDTESRDEWVAAVFFNHNVDSIAPSGE